MFSPADIAAEQAHIKSLESAILFAAVMGHKEKIVAMKEDLHDRKLFLADVLAINADVAAGLYAMDAVSGLPVGIPAKTLDFISDLVEGMR